VLWIDGQKQIYLLNSKVRNFLTCVVFEEEYSKIYTFQDVENSILVTYETSTKVKINKLRLLTYQYELVNMKANENKEIMFNKFQTITCLGVLVKTMLIMTIFNLSNLLKPHAITLTISKSLDNMSIEKLIGILKMHDMELEQDDVIKKEKTIVFKACHSKFTPPRNSK